MRKHSGFGISEFIIGLCMIFMGILTFVKPGSVFTGFAVLYGIIAVVTGIFDIIFYIKTERYTGFGPIVSMISGTLSIMSGIMLLAYPQAGKAIVSIIFPIWFIAHCVSRLVHMKIIKLIAGKFYFIFSLTANIIGIILGILMLLQPRLAIYTAGTVIGIYLILFGCESIVISFSKIGSKR